MIFSETSLLCTALQIIIHIVPPIRTRYENDTNKLAAQKTSGGSLGAILRLVGGVHPQRVRNRPSLAGLSEGKYLLFSYGDCLISARVRESPTLPLYSEEGLSTSQFGVSVYGLRTPGAGGCCRSVDGPRLRRVGRSWRSCSRHLTLLSLPGT